MKPQKALNTVSSAPHRSTAYLPMKSNRNRTEYCCVTGTAVALDMSADTTGDVGFYNRAQPPPGLRAAFLYSFQHNMDIAGESMRATITRQHIENMRLSQQVRQLQHQLEQAPSSATCQCPTIQSGFADNCGKVATFKVVGCKCHGPTICAECADNHLQDLLRDGEAACPHTCPVCEAYGQVISQDARAQDELNRVLDEFIQPCTTRMRDSYFTPHAPV